MLCVQEIQYIVNATLHPADLQYENITPVPKGIKIQHFVPVLSKFTCE